MDHYSRFEVCLFIIRQNMNFGFWQKILVQIIADYVYFHMTYHTFVWNHASWHRSVLNMTHFQLFPWFGQTLLVRKMGKKSKLFILDTFVLKFGKLFLKRFFQKILSFCMASIQERVIMERTRYTFNMTTVISKHFGTSIFMESFA